MEERVEEVVVTRVKHGMHHGTGDTQHGGTVVSSGKVLGSTRVLVGGGGVEFDNTGKQQDLGNTEKRNVGQSGEAHAILQDGIKVVGAVHGKATGEGNAQFLEDHTDKGGHGDTAVLDFDGTTTREGVQVRGQTKRVEQVERTGVDTQTIGGTGVTVERGGHRGLLWRWQ